MVKLFKCAHCGNIVEMVEDKGVKPACCGEAMQLMNPNTTDAAQEKHVPVVTIDGQQHRTSDDGRASHRLHHLGDKSGRTEKISG